MLSRGAKKEEEEEEKEEEEEDQEEKFTQNCTRARVGEILLKQSSERCGPSSPSHIPLGGGKVALLAGTCCCVWLT